jgi:hypothetical protein
MGVNRGQNTKLPGLGCDFHAHDFDEHANARSVVQMQKTTKEVREWPRQ